MNTAIIVIGVLLVILIISLIIYYFFYYNKSNIIKYKITLITDETTFNEEYSQSFKMNELTTRKTLSIPDLGYGLSFSWEMYIPNKGSNENWNNKFNIVKPILSMNDSPQIGYNPKKNYISIILKYRDNPFYSKYNEIKIQNIKQQKWNKYIIIISGRIVNIYVNNVLEISKILPSLPVIYDISSEIVLGQVNNNFHGKIRNLTLYPFPLHFNDVQNID
jgi:hypothetical protein